MQKSLLLLFIVLTIISCVNLILKSVGIFDKDVDYKVLSDGSKKVIFIPMHHVGLKEFYNGTRRLVDSLEREGFITYYESVRSENIDSVELDLVNRKIRKVMGFAINKDGYLDTINNTLGGVIKYKGKHKLMNQPKYYLLGVDTLKAIKADIAANVLIEKFEEDNGRIKLEDCDLQTPFSSPYSCKKADKETRKIFFKKYAVDFRNKHLANEVVKSKNDKITIIFGAKHYSGLMAELKAHNNNWRKQ